MFDHKISLTMGFYLFSWWTKTASCFSLSGSYMETLISVMSVFEEFLHIWATILVSFKRPSAKRHKLFQGLNYPWTFGLFSFLRANEIFFHEHALIMISMTSILLLATLIIFKKSNLLDWEHFWDHDVLISVYYVSLCICSTHISARAAQNVEIDEHFPILLLGPH